MHGLLIGPGLFQRPFFRLSLQEIDLSSDEGSIATSIKPHGNYSPLCEGAERVVINFVQNLKKSLLIPFDYRSAWSRLS